MEYIDFLKKKIAISGNYGFDIDIAEINPMLKPHQVDIVKRIINRYSNKCDIVFDPFGGIMTVPYMAIKMERFGMASELNPEYFRDGVKYLESYERGQKQMSLFDFIEMKKEKPA